MSVAEDLRLDADAALSDGGMYYSGWYLSGIATRVEALEDENANLRELVELMRACPTNKSDCDECRRLNDLCEVDVLARELGIEVEQR